MSVSTIKQAIYAPKMKVFRRAYIKRRSSLTGLFESSWVEITEDVKKWGSIRSSVDSERSGKFTLDSMRLAFHNDAGRYNPNDNENSIWYGYLSQQRTLVRIDAGFVHETLGSDLIWRRVVFPNAGQWDVSDWDVGIFDGDVSSQVYVGLISGDIHLSDQNEVTVQVKPLTQIFKDYPAGNLVGLGNSLTASGFIQLLRDQTDGSSNFVFRPFFGDTITYWDISATSNVYADLNTTTASGIRDKTVWDIIEKLAEAENFTAYVDQNGTFHFIPKTAAASIEFEFHGIGSFDTEYGHTIKNISRYGKDVSRYYTRVQLKYREADTSTSYVTIESTFAVNPTNAPWAYGHKTFSMENIWIPTSTVANTIAQSVYNEVSALKDVVEFTTSFVPHLTLLDRVSMHYDSTSRASPGTLWDANDWDTELTFDSSEGDAIILEGQEFKFLNIEINLDSFECKYVARAI